MKARGTLAIQDNPSAKMVQPTHTWCFMACHGKQILFRIYVCLLKSKQCVYINKILPW